MARKHYHLSLPTPFHPTPLVLTAVLFVLHFTHGVSWWIVAAPTLLCLAAILLGLVAFRLLLAWLNHGREFRRHHMLAKFGGYRR